MLHLEPDEHECAENRRHQPPTQSSDRHPLPVSAQSHAETERRDVHAPEQACHSPSPTVAQQPLPI